jgi:hypothetical protein
MVTVLITLILVLMIMCDVSWPLAVLLVGLMIILMSLMYWLIDPSPHHGRLLVVIPLQCQTGEMVLGTFPWWVMVCWDV